MRHTFVITAIVLALAVGALGQRRELPGYDPSTLPQGKTETEKRILATLDQIMKTHETYLNVPVPDGRALRLLTEAAGAKIVVEIGTSTGYSGLWFCLALERTGGRL